MEKTSPKMGRPPKNKAELRNHSIYVRLTQAEKLACEAAANGPNVGQWARSVLLRAAKRVNS